MQTVVAAIIGAAVALITLAWQQWIARIQARHDLLRTKLEDLCRVIVSIRGRAIQATRLNSLPQDIDKQKEVVEALQWGITEDLLQAQMLQALYFTKLGDHINRILNAGGGVVGSREHFDGGGKSKGVHPLVHVEKFQNLTMHANEMLRYVNSEYEDLTEARRSFFGWRIES